MWQINEYTIMYNAVLCGELINQNWVNIKLTILRNFMPYHVGNSEVSAFWMNLLPTSSNLLPSLQHICNYHKTELEWHWFMWRITYSVKNSSQFLVRHIPHLEWCLFVMTQIIQSLSWCYTGFVYTSLYGNTC